jgi:ATP-dependent DNA helicase RecG
MIESSPIDVLPGVGPKVAQLFKRLGITTVGDLLRHFPIGYDDYTTQLNTSMLEPGRLGWMEGKVTNVKARRSFGKRGLYITEATLLDDFGLLRLIWFNRFPIKNLPTDKLIRVGGRIETDGSIRNPMWEFEERPSRFAGTLLARYPLTVGLSQTAVRNAIRLASIVTVKEQLPQEIIDRYNLLSINEAIQKIHNPNNLKEINEAKRRLAFDEIFLLQLAEAIHKNKRRTLKAHHINSNQLVVDRFIASLPFKLTKHQLTVISEINADLKRDWPMNRLLQGEVGSGKTIVAGVVAVGVIERGYQVLYLAPTEILATQQFESLSQLFKTLGYRVALFTRGTQMTNYDVAGKTAVSKEINSNKVDLVIGTHSVLNEKIVLQKLALVVVDEQHRFGVEQRMMALKQGEYTPHLLSMTATPIPRTLQQAYYSDLDISTLKSVATGKRNITTYLANENQRSLVEDRLRSHLDRGEQAYVVCPLIDPSDKLSVRAATTEYERLRGDALQNYRVGYLHGRMKAEEKQDVLNSFRDNKLDVLVATSVVEVGIDIPNATTIIIEGAERFGLAQLHQLRGRVGRAGQSGFCLLFAEKPSEQAWERLKKFADTKDGFALAELDLALRGPGEWFGVKQSGYPDFKIASLADYQILEQAKEVSSQLVNDDPNLENHPVLSQRVEKFVRLASLG